MCTKGAALNGHIKVEKVLNILEVKFSINIYYNLNKAFRTNTKSITIIKRPFYGEVYLQVEPKYEVFKKTGL